MSGIANVAIVLQNTTTNVMLAVMTGENGNFSFENVPIGSYHLKEAYGTPGVVTPGDFTNAADTDVITAVIPPISYAPNPPPGATNLDCTTRNTLPITVTGANINNVYICNAPVRYSPINIDTDVYVHWAENFINMAEGHFGRFPAGTPVMTGANPNPYPTLNPGFNYVLPENGSPNPRDGEFTIQNIATTISYQNNNVWWRIADKSTGNETGRMMVINGANPDAIFFQDTVMVEPFAYYLFSTWVLNLIKITGRTDPELGVIITTPDGKQLFNNNIGASIPVNQEEPEWHQVGTIIQAGDFSTLTVQFISLGPPASGNDYVIDNVGLHLTDIPIYSPVKTVTPSAAAVGDIVTFTVVFTNDSNLPLTDIEFVDPIPNGLVFVPESVVINEVSCEAYDPNIGFAVPDLAVGDDAVISFEAVAVYVPWMGQADNTSSVSYSSQLVQGMSPIQLSSKSNTAKLVISAKLCPITSIVFKRERSILDLLQQDTAITFDKQLLARGAIEYHADGRIDILEQGCYVVNWFVAAMAGFATDGQQYMLKKFYYTLSSWGPLVSAGNQIKNSATIGFAVVNVTGAEITDYGKVTIAVFNNADSDTKPTFFEPNAGIIVWGANFSFVEQRTTAIENNIVEIDNHVQDVEQFVYISSVTYTWSDSPQLSGAGVAYIHVGHLYNFWGIGSLDFACTLSIGTSYYLLHYTYSPPIEYYQGDDTIGTLWIQDLITGTSRYPLHFDGTGIYITPSGSLSLSAGTKLSFTQWLILVNPLEV